MSRLIQDIVAGIRRREPRALAKAITLIESTRPEHRAQAGELMGSLGGDGTDRGSIRVGISGAPGVGKSTFIEAFGLAAIKSSRRVAVLSVDPSSTLSGGSILGDKTRMVELAKRAEAYIRPSPSAAELGGVARRTREAVLVCEAAGFDLVLVETVGVGQSEIAVRDMTDTFVLLLQPAAGDELQGIKRGIVELADIVLVNKADGELKAAAERTMAEYRNALRLLRPRSQQWTPFSGVCSALTGEGIVRAWRAVVRRHGWLTESGELARLRAGQGQAWLWEEISGQLISRFKSHPAVRSALAELGAQVAVGSISPPAAAAQLLALFTQDDSPGG